MKTSIVYSSKTGNTRQLADAIAAALPGVTLTGVTGSISFDEIGDANKDMAYIKKANTETVAFDFVKTQTVAELDK